MCTAEELLERHRMFPIAGHLKESRGQMGENEKTTKIES